MSIRFANARESAAHCSPERQPAFKDRGWSKSRCGFLRATQEPGRSTSIWVGSPMAAAGSTGPLMFATDGPCVKARCRVDRAAGASVETNSLRITGAVGRPSGSRGDGMIVVVGRVQADADKRDALVRIGHAVAAASREETGCISYRLYEDTEVQNEFVFVEEWESNEALQRHFATSHIREFMQAIPATLVAPPDVKFHTIAATMDLSEIRTG
jgi:quinol monooxygenase YgiN